MQKNKLFNNIYSGKRVLVTGHTGFKGSWLVAWLSQMGAKLAGYALDPQTEPSLFNLLDIDITDIRGDIRDREALIKLIKKFDPEVVFHLAAQAIVLESYKNPIDTFETNVVGTLNVYKACEFGKSLKAIVSVTTDKVYKNNEWVFGYRECDPFGGYDPYSASKACVEVATESWRSSFLNIEKFGKEHGVLLATARAGNVIGGGDWAEYRLIPDIMRAWEKGETVVIRQPFSVRPWEHVLEPLSGYLCLGEKLLSGQKDFAQGWNFGPSSCSVLSVGDVCKIIGKKMPEIKFELSKKEQEFHEATLLKLDVSKADKYLNWKSVWSMEESVEKTISWYSDYYKKSEINVIKNIEQYIESASEKKLAWAMG